MDGGGGEGKEKMYGVEGTHMKEPVFKVSLKTLNNKRK